MVSVLLSRRGLTPLRGPVYTPPSTPGGARGSGGVDPETKSPDAPSRPFQELARSPAYHSILQPSHTVGPSHRGFRERAQDPLPLSCPCPIGSLPEVHHDPVSPPFPLFHHRLRPPAPTCPKDPATSVSARPPAGASEGVHRKLQQVRLPVREQA